MLSVQLQRHLLVQGREVEKWQYLWPMGGHRQASPGIWGVLEFDGLVLSADNLIKFLTLGRPGILCATLGKCKADVNETALKLDRSEIARITCDLYGT